LTVPEICARLTASGCRLPSRMTVSRWAQGATSPFSGMRLFRPRPSDELSFFLGAWLGDGWGDVSDGGKRIRLKVRSKSFAENFATSAGAILEGEPYKVWTTQDARGPWYNVKVTSYMLFDFLSGDLRAVRPYIERYPVGFLRGFFTAEGNPSVSVSQRGPSLSVGLDLSNSDYELLDLTRSLLIGLGLHPSRIRLVQLKGEVTNLARATRPGWLLTVLRFEDVLRFATVIKFADNSKQQKLEDALRLVSNCDGNQAVSEWKSLYQKRKGKWIKKG
jgi:intein-encoded DNA endonuclease-like protein